MSTKERALFWLIILVIIAVFIAHIHGILLPFIVAIATAYFLDPAVDRLEAFNMSRLSATFTIMGIFFGILIILILLLAPLLYNQFQEFSEKIPEYSQYVQQNLIPRISKLLISTNAASAQDIQNALKDVSGTAFRFLGEMLADIWHSGLALVNLISLLVITPVVTFHVLRNWHKIITTIDGLLPRQHIEEFRYQFSLMDKALSGFIRGQTNVCLIMGTYYAIGLSLVGLQFGFFIGFMTGILTFIPYIGVFVGTLTGITVAFFQFDHSIGILMVAAVFVLGQLLEGNIITPKLVGDKVGLSPVWLIFGMLSGAALFGLMGVLIAVPTTAVVAVLIRFAVSKYLQSALYTGLRR